MKKGRVEAFSDGVLAIIVTIMVLELKVPEGAAWSDLFTLLPKFLSYILSFMMVLIYWNNHHHVFQTVEKVNGKILLANGFFIIFSIIDSICYGLDGRKPFCLKTRSLNGNRISFIGNFLFIVVKIYYTLAWRRFCFSKSCGK